MRQTVPVLSSEQIASIAYTWAEGHFPIFNAIGDKPPKLEATNVPDHNPLPVSSSLAHVGL